MRRENIYELACVAADRKPSEKPCQLAAVLNRRNVLVGNTTLIKPPQNSGKPPETHQQADYLFDGYLRRILAAAMANGLIFESGAAFIM
jgi:hypothetical protein